MPVERPRVRYNVEKITADMAAKGWNATKLAKQTGYSVPTITRFLSGKHQTPKVAKAIAEALEHSGRYYQLDVDVALTA